MRAHLTVPILLATGLLAGCAGSGPSAPAPPTGTPTFEDAVGPAVPTGHGLADGVLGIARVTVDPAGLTAALEPGRTSQTQGDLYQLSIRPFQGPGDIEVTRVRKEASNVVVTVKFRHPFDASVDLNPPATATKRIDLHIFDVNALVVAEGSDSFFAASDGVVANTDLLVNADAYRMPGQLFNAGALGITSANTFPYKLVARNLDTVNPAGNYVPTAHGWTGPTLLDPYGYDVFPQGAEVEVDFELAVGATPTAFHLVTLAKYMDPRATPQPKLKRLPVPGDPASLRYILPEAAGDIQKIDVTVTGDLVSGSSSEVVPVEVTILDWDHGATVAVPFPNDADLSQIAEPSDVNGVTADVPQVRSSGPLGFPSVAGAAPILNTTAGLTNEASYSAPAGGGYVKGMVRVTDQQDDSAPVPVALDESLQPTAPAPSTRYQAFRVFVTAPGGPSCLEYAPNAPALQAVQDVGYRLDIDSAVVPATDPDGIGGYRVDYNNDGTWDTGVRQPDGTPAPDFTADPAWTYGVTGPQTIQVEVRDAAVPPFTTVCTYTVTVTAGAGIVMDPYPVPGGINWNMGAQQVLANASCRTPLIAERTGGDVYQMMIQNISGPYMVYRSTDGGLTWPGPNGNPLPNWANGNVTPTNSNFGLSVLANGLPAVGVRDSGGDLAYIAAQSESAGTITWGPASNGVEIETAGTWTQVNVVPHPTNANRVYLIAQNTASGGGPNYRQISLWLSTNAASANPTFTLLPTFADSANSSTNTENDINAVADSTGAIHVAWYLDPTDQVFYRKFIDDGSTSGGAWAAPEAVIGAKEGPTGSFFGLDLAVNALDEPAVAWVDEDPSSPPFTTGNPNMAMLTKYNAGTGWTSQRRVSEPSVAYENNIFDPDIAFDQANRIHIVWRDNRQDNVDFMNTTYEVWGSVFTVNGTTRLVNDFEILAAPNRVDDYPQFPRAVYSSASNRVIVTSDIFDNATVVTDGRYRYRTYRLIP